MVFLDDQNKVIYVKGGAWIQKANIPAAWTHVGYVYFRKGKQVGVIHKDGADEKWRRVSLRGRTLYSMVLSTEDHRLRFGIGPNWDTTSITFYIHSYLHLQKPPPARRYRGEVTELGATSCHHR